MKDKIITKEAFKLQCAPEWSWDSDYNDWKGYHFWYVYSGGATITTSDAVYHLKQNDLFLFDLNENHICRHNPEHPLGVYAIYFQSAQLDASCISRKHIINAPFLGEIIQNNVRLFEQNEMEILDIWMQAILTEFTSKAQAHHSEHSVASVLQQHFKEKMCEMLTLEQMCQITGYSKNHLIRIVQKETGCTPIHLQLKYKLEHAKSLLSYSNEGIAMIGMSVGFLDANYFTKVFKQYVGVPPTEFRRNGRLESTSGR